MGEGRETGEEEEQQLVVASLGSLRIAQVSALRSLHFNHLRAQLSASLWGQKVFVFSFSLLLELDASSQKRDSQKRDQFALMINTSCIQQLDTFTSSWLTNKLAT